MKEVVETGLQAINNAAKNYLEAREQDANNQWQCWGTLMDMFRIVSPVYREAIEQGENIDLSPYPALLKYIELGDTLAKIMAQKAKETVWNAHLNKN